MRDLAQPKVLTSAVTAALATSIATYPRLALWTLRPHAIWLLVGIIFSCAWVLWAFVFAWHTRYTRCPVIAKKLEPMAFLVTAAVGIIIGVTLHFGFDSALKARIPEEFPTSGSQWVAMTLFSLAFQQLFLLFAPLAFFSRLLNSGRIAVILTLFFGGMVMLMKAHTATATMPWVMGSGYLLIRMMAGLLSIYFYLRGGILLAYWWGLIVQSRQLLDFV